MEGKSIAIVEIVSSSKMEHNSTDRRGGAPTAVISTGVRYGVISTGVILIHHICVGGGDGAISGNADDANYSIVSSSSLLYLRITINQTKEDILQRRVVCVKKKYAPKGPRECDIHHTKATKALSQTFGVAKHFVTKNSEGGYKSNKYTEIQS